jgi:restriction system protein
MEYYMARKTSGFDLLIGLPWWVSCILAAAAYIALKFILPGIPFENPLLLGMARTAPNLAGVVALLFSFAAALSLFLQFKKGRLVERQTDIASIRSLSWKQFEFLLSEAFRRKGYSVQENLRSGADGGVDLVLTKNGEVTLVQCKQWKTSSVGVTVVRELYGVVTAEGAGEGIVVCSGSYTRDAVEFANKVGIQLLGGNELSVLISGVQQSATFAAAPSNPACPFCGKEMVQRIAQKGKNIGKRFWGCSAYPKCRGTR